MKQDNINRRDFLKKAGSAALVMGGLGAFAGCKNSTASAGIDQAADEPGEMTYRINNGNGDKVSILGYGCMRWPMIKDENGKDVVDQETKGEMQRFLIKEAQRGSSELEAYRNLMEILGIEYPKEREDN